MASTLYLTGILHPNRAVRLCCMGMLYMACILRSSILFIRYEGVRQVQQHQHESIPNTSQLPPTARLCRWSSKGVSSGRSTCHPACPRCAILLCYAGNWYRYLAWSGCFTAACTFTHWRLSASCCWQCSCGVGCRQHNASKSSQGTGLVQRVTRVSLQEMWTSKQLQQQACG